jgi:hypothetical protein
VAGIAVEHGCDWPEWSVLNWNEPAIAFYRSLGATLTEWSVYQLTGQALLSVAQHEVG